MHKEKTLIIPVSPIGGQGKTVCQILIASYLQTRGFTVAAMDADTAKHGKPGSFGWQFRQVGVKDAKKAFKLDLRKQGDCDQLLRQTAQNSEDYTVVDFPANSQRDLSRWFDEVCNPQVLQRIGIQIIGVGAITPEEGSADGVVDWIASMSRRARYLVMLNRRTFEAVEEHPDTAFKDWFALKEAAEDQEIQAVYVPNLYSEAMSDLVRSTRLPCQLANSSIDFLNQLRIETWSESVNDQLDHTGYFPIEKEQ